MDELVDIARVEVLAHKRVRLTYVDGLVGDVDFQDRDWKGVLTSLNEPDFFAQVFVSRESGTLTWPGELDLAPEPLREAARANEVEWLPTPLAPPWPPERIRFLYRRDGDTWFAESPDLERWTMRAASYEQLREYAIESIPFALGYDEDELGETVDVDIPIEHFVLEPAA